MELAWADQIWVEGKAQGKAESLLKVMALRNIKIDQFQKNTALTCIDVVQLDTWLEKALTATSAEQVFGKPTKAKATKKK